MAHGPVLGAAVAPDGAGAAVTPEGGGVPFERVGVLCGRFATHPASSAIPRKIAVRIYGVTDTGIATVVSEPSCLYAVNVREIFCGI